MSYTYSGNPGASALDMVRFLIGDTSVVTDPQLTDAEITALLTITANNAYSASMECVKALLAKYSRVTDKSMGDLSISYSQRAKNYQSLLQQLRVQAVTMGGVAGPYAGGISISDKDANEDDSDLVKPAFRVGMHDSVPPLDESLGG